MVDMHIRKDQETPFFIRRFIKNIEESKFRAILIDKYDFKDQDFEQKSLKQVYIENWESKEIFDSIMFDCAMFNHLKNIFIYNISIEKEVFKSDIINLLRNINNTSNINIAVKSKLNNVEEFNFITLLGEEDKLSDKFAIALKYKEDNDIDEAQILFTQVVKNMEGDTLHSLAGVRVDFVNQKLYLSLKGFTGLQKGDTEILKAHLKTTLASYRDWVIEKLSPLITFETQDEEDLREKMYLLCKKYDDELLKEDRRQVKKLLESIVERDINTYISSLKTDISEDDKKILLESFLSLMTGTYVKNNYKESELKERAKNLKLEGYPTSINYTSSNFNKGATKSANKDAPVAGSEIFHSLYANFTEANSLEKWAIAWFTDIDHKDSENLEVFRTTIAVKSKFVHLIFHPKKELNEEFVRYVIRTINQ